jgi:uncharacterized heparinase superfamily protein
VERADGWITPTRVRLLNIEHEFESGIDWRPSGLPRLWVYTLNYFEDLPQRAGAGADDGHAARLVDLWIEANPPGTAETWDPYPISIRAVNWIKWMLLREERGVGPNQKVIDSLAAQLRFLERWIEFDIMANHLMANAVALTAGGLFFAGAEGERFLVRGARLLAGQVREQVNEDGGHFERSPMYHAVVLEQLLDVVNLLGVFPGTAADRLDLEALLRRTVPGMLEWLEALTHPDGGAGFFHDTTLGSTPTCAALARYAARLGVTHAPLPAEHIHWLGHSDYFRINSVDGRTVVLFDAGVPAPRYQPGHAHAESLSFELSRDGRRVFVNSGVSTYEAGRERLWERGTAAHNTVRIDRTEQSEIWASHRCGRRAVLLHAGRMEGRAVAAHSGFDFLPGRPTHNREILVEDWGVEITDSIDGSGEHLLEWFFHLHPNVDGRVVGREVELSVDGRAFARVGFTFGAVAAIERGSWHPGFNVSVPNTFITVALRASLPFESITTIEWC